MRLVTFTTTGGPGKRLGAFTENDTVIVDFGAAAQHIAPDEDQRIYASMLDLIDGGPTALARAGALLAKVISQGAEEALIERDQVRLEAPLPNPRRLRDCTCFLQHLRNAREVRYTRLAAREDDPDAALKRFRAAGAMDVPKEWEAVPVYLNSNHLNIIGPEDNAIWPNRARRMDYELEWAMVTGKAGTDIPAEEAADHFFGFTIFNDISARDIQAREIRTGAGMGGPGKDFDAGNIMGPCIVTADEIANPYNLDMVARINGEEWSRGNSSMMDHSFEVVLAHLSRSQTIYPGEIFGSGTVPSGCGLEHNRYLSDGDRIELEIEGIGSLSNRIVKPDGWLDRDTPDRN
ncbi:MAG: isomerase [Alphaproteobacteria bacterium]|nr:isomerase [Alphaproteobacteria bacterium]